MVLFRGGVGRGRGFPRPMLGPRHMRPHGFERDFIPPFVLPRGRPNMLTGPPIRPRPMPPPRMIHPPLPSRPRLPPPPRPHLPPPLPPHIPLRDLHYPPIPPPVRGLGIPPPIPPVPPFRRLIRPQPSIRGRGALTKRGIGVKRLVYSNGIRTKKNQKRKEKTEGSFYCETCDRSWKTEEKLKEHVAEHEVCGREGCKFTAHPKVVMKHIQIQHETGLYNRISSEDTAKWIAERKSRYPTKENMEKKEAEKKEMIERGERIPSQGKRFEHNLTTRNWRHKRQRMNENKVEVKKEKPRPYKSRKPCEDSQWRDPDAWRGDLPQFPGTAAFPPEEESKDSKGEENFSDDDEWTDTTQPELPKPAVSNILTYIMASYGSDMSDEDEEPVNISQNTAASIPIRCAEKEQASPPKIEERNNVQVEDSESGPEECAVEHEDKSNVPILKGKETKEQEHKQKEDFEEKNKDRFRPAQLRVPMKRRKLSLLEKLLKNEIRHERNVILQCVRYIVKNNFIGCGNLPKCQSIDR